MKATARLNAYLQFGKRICIGGLFGLAAYCLTNLSAESYNAEAGLASTFAGIMSGYLYAFQKQQFSDEKIFDMGESEESIYDTNRQSPTTVFYNSRGRRIATDSSSSCCSRNSNENYKYKRV